MNRNVMGTQARTWLAGALCALLISPLHAAPSAIIIEAESADALIANLVTAGGALGQPMLSEAMLSGILGGMINAPGFVGIDTAKPIQLHVMLPAGDKDGAEFSPEELRPISALILPLQGNGQGYAAAVASAFPKVDTVGAIQHFVRDAMPGVMPAKELYMATESGHAIIGEQLDAVESIRDLLKQRSGKLPAVSFPGVLHATLDMDACIPYVETAVRQMVTAMRQQPMPPEVPMDPASILAAEGDALLAFMRELRSYSLGISASPDAIKLLDRIVPKPGTKTANWVAGMGAPSAATLSVIPADALFASVGSGMNMMDQLAEPYADLMEQIYGSMGPPMDKMGPVIRKMMLDLKGVYAGDFAVGVVPAVDGKGVAFVETIALVDPAAAKRRMDEMLATFNTSFGEAMQGVQLVTLPSRSYKGTEIQLFAYKVDRDAAPAAAQPFQPASMKWIEGLRWELAYVGNDLVYCGGGPAIMDATLERLAKKSGTPLTQSDAFRKLFPTTKGTPVELHTLSLTKLIKSLLLTVPELPPALLASIPEGSAGMAGYSIVSQGALIGIDRISFDEITALQGIIPTLSTAMPMIMQQMGIALPVPPQPEQAFER